MPDRPRIYWIDDLTPDQLALLKVSYDEVHYLRDDADLTYCGRTLDRIYTGGISDVTCQDCIAYDELLFAKESTYAD